MGISLENMTSQESLNHAWEKFKSYAWSVGLNEDNLNQAVEMLVTMQAKLDVTWFALLRAGKYKAKSLRWQRIKPTSRNRKIYPPQVFDCLVQQLVVDAFMPKLSLVGIKEPQDPHTRQEESAVNLRHLESELPLSTTWVCEIRADLCLGERNRSRVSRVVDNEVSDHRVTSLVTRSMVSTAKCDLKPTGRDVFVGPLYNMLLDIELLALDNWLDKNGYRWLRERGMCWVFCDTEEQAQKAAEEINDVMLSKLYLQSEAFSVQAMPLEQANIYGFSTHIEDGKISLRVHDEAWKDFKYEVRRITSRSYGEISNEVRASMLTNCLRQWAGYNRYANIDEELRDIDEWVTTRIRMDIWKQQKLIRGRIRFLEERGIPKGAAFKMANSRLGYWASAQEPILKKALNRTVLWENYGFLLPERAVRQEQAVLQDALKEAHCEGYPWSIDAPHAKGLTPTKKRKILEERKIEREAREALEAGGARDAGGARGAGGAGAAGGARDGSRGGVRDGSRGENKRGGQSSNRKSDQSKSSNNKTENNKGNNNKTGNNKGSNKAGNSNDQRRKS